MHFYKSFNKHSEVQRHNSPYLWADCAWGKHQCRICSLGTVSSQDPPPACSHWCDSEGIRKHVIFSARISCMSSFHPQLEYVRETAE